MESDVSQADASLVALSTSPCNNLTLINPPAGPPRNDELQLFQTRGLKWTTQLPQPIVPHIWELLLLPCFGRWSQWRLRSWFA